MTNRIDLASLPAPDVVEVLDFEDIYQELLAEFRALYTDWTAVLESDPVVKLLELAAYREMLLRARINDAARAVLLAYAGGSDLDHLAALLGVTRLDGENDARLRVRTQLSLEGFSTAGPRLSYKFHALSASQYVRDVAVSSPAPGRVVVTVLAEPGDDYPNGKPSAALLDAVLAKVNADDIRPLTDLVSVAAPEILTYTVRADLVVASGPDSVVVLAAAIAACQTYAAEQFRLGHDVAISGLHAALHQPGVVRVDLASPAESITVAANQAARCTGIKVAIAGVST